MYAWVCTHGSQWLPGHSRFTRLQREDLSKVEVGTSGRFTAMTRFFLTPLLSIAKLAYFLDLENDGSHNHVCGRGLFRPVVRHTLPVLCPSGVCLNRSLLGAMSHQGPCCHRSAVSLQRRAATCIRYWCLTRLVFASVCGFIISSIGNMKGKLYISSTFCSTLLLLLFAGTIFCEFLRFRKKRKLPAKISTNISGGVYTITNRLRDVFHFATCIIIIILSWSFLPFLFFFPVPSRARESDV